MMKNPLVNQYGKIDFATMSSRDILPNEVLFNLPENPNWKITSFGRLVRLSKANIINYCARLDFTKGRTFVVDGIIPSNLAGKRPEALLALIDGIQFTSDTTISYKDKNPNNFSRENIQFHSKSNPDEKVIIQMELDEVYDNMDPELYKSISELKAKYGLKEISKVIELLMKKES